MKERHDIDELKNEFTNKNFLYSKIAKIFKFMVAIISIIATVITIYTICKHNKLKPLVTSLALQQVKEVEVEGMENIDYNCKCMGNQPLLFHLMLKQGFNWFYINSRKSRSG